MQRGISINHSGENLKMTPENDDRVFMKTGEEKHLIILARTWEDVYQIEEYSCYYKGDKDSYKVRVTCPTFNRIPDPDTDVIAAEAMFNDHIKRSYLMLIPVVDCSTFAKKDNSRGGYYKKVWALKKTNAGKFVEIAKELIGDNPFLSVVKVKRTEEKGGASGDFFMPTIDKKTGMAMRLTPDFFWRDSKPVDYRLRDYVGYVQDREKRKLTLEQGAKEYFLAPFDYERYIKPTPQKVKYFMSYIKRMSGITSTPDNYEMEDFGATFPNTTPSFGGGGSFGDVSYEEEVSNDVKASGANVPESAPDEPPF